jgi:hypothetical protein
MPRRSHVFDTERESRRLRGDLEEALRALEFVGRALELSVGDGLVGGMQSSALEVVDRLRRKHNPGPRSRADAAA